MVERLDYTSSMSGSNGAFDCLLRPVLLMWRCNVKTKDSPSVDVVSRTSSALGATSSPSPVGGVLNVKTPAKLPLDAQLLDSLEWQGPVSPVYTTDSGLEINAGVYLVDLDNTNETTM